MTPDASQSRGSASPHGCLPPPAALGQAGPSALHGLGLGTHEDFEFTRAGSRILFLRETAMSIQFRPQPASSCLPYGSSVFSGLQAALSSERPSAGRRHDELPRTGMRGWPSGSACDAGSRVVRYRFLRGLAKLPGDVSRKQKKGNVDAQTQSSTTGSQAG